MKPRVTKELTHTHLVIVALKHTMAKDKLKLEIAYLILGHLSPGLLYSRGMLETSCIKINQKMNDQMFMEKSCLNKREEIWSMPIQRYNLLCVCTHMCVYRGGRGGQGEIIKGADR